MMDEKFTGLPAPNQHSCTRCGRFWDKDSEAEPPGASFTYYRPDWEEDGKRYIGGYYMSDTPIPGGQTKFGDEPDGSLNDRYTQENNARALECYENGHEGWEHVYPDGISSYEGLHTLKTGDRLDVYSNESRKVMVWSGVIDLRAFKIFTESAAGMWVHSEQIDEDRELWAKMFFDELPCTLVTGDTG